MPEAIRLTFDPRSVADYQRFLAAKTLPKYRIQGRTAIVPAEYAGRLGLAPTRLYYHINLLEKHGLLVVDETRTVGNLIEKRGCVRRCHGGEEAACACRRRLKERASECLSL